MELMTKLIGYGLSQVVGASVDNIVEAIDHRFSDHSQELTRSLVRANDHAWQSVAVALGGEGLLGSLQSLVISGDVRGVRDQVRGFLASQSGTFEGTEATFRRSCLDELKQARKAGLLSAASVVPLDLAHQAVTFRRAAAPLDLVSTATQAVSQIADELARDFPHLAQLLRQPTPAGPPLLAAAFLFFFRREVEVHPELASGLTFDALRQLSASQAEGFAAIGGALDTLGDRFDTALEQLGRIEATVGQTQSAVLDMHAELHRLGASQAASASDLRQLLQETLAHLARLNMQSGAVRPEQSLSIRADGERRAVRHLAERYERLPEAERRQAPALLNGLGKLQYGAGDFAAASQAFAAVADEVPGGLEQAEAYANVYRAALEQRHWDRALAARLRAAAADPKRFEPFPLRRYEPKRILGAGGFGTAFLCHDRFFKTDVVIKTLHADDLDRNLDDVFAEAQALRQVQHPAVIDVLECGYADLTAMSRPYIVMEYFPGVSLTAHLKDHGQLTPTDLLAIARLIADGMREVHRRRILHRDLKPDNVLVRQTDGQWEARIIDFGLALRRQATSESVTESRSEHTLRGEEVAGTVKYAPPEQMGETPGIHPGPYSDVYSFGKLCCFALFGTTEPRSRQLNSVPALWRELLEACLEQVEYRLYDFERVVRVLDVLAGERHAAAPAVPHLVPAAAPVKTATAPPVASPREQEQARALLAEARPLMARLEEVQRQAEQAHAERELKVQSEAASPSPAGDQVVALAAWLTKLESTAAEGKWKPASIGLAKWLTQARQQLAAAELARDACAAALQARRELRGLLQALQAKALSCGRAEDEALASLAREASLLLKRRPTPMAKAQELVAAYEARLL